MRGLAHASDIEVLAARIGSSFRAPFIVLGHQLIVSASIGMAYAGPGKTISHELVADADMAMYQAKRNGGGHQIIDVRQARQAVNRSNLEQDLHAAFSEQNLDLAFQPIVRTADGLVTGVEALLRWTHPERGPIRALDMIRIAEDNGLITQIGAWVLHQACQAHQGWRDKFPDQPLDLAVNASVRQLLGPDFTATVGDILRDTAMEPTCLTLEVTEAIFIQDSARATTVLAELRALGIRVALDDFGTGYSSLSYLRQFPVDILKIDRSFTANLTRDPVDSAIVTAIAALAHALKLSVIAEGVETSEQRDQVAAIGCESCQGYLYAPALPAPEITRLLHTPDGRQLHLPPTRALNLPIG